MALREVRIDDLDGESLATTHVVSINGVTWEIDLSDEHFNEMWALVKPYTDHGRLVHDKAKRRTSKRTTSTVKSTTSPPKKRTQKPRKTTRKAKANGTANAENKQIRTWAQEQGLDIAARGAIPKAIVQQYHEAQQA